MIDMLTRPVKPIPTPHAEINEIHLNLYETLDTAVQTINELTETIEDLDERVKALEGDDEEEVNPSNEEI